MVCLLILLSTYFSAVQDKAGMKFSLSKLTNFQAGNNHLNTHFGIGIVLKEGDKAEYGLSAI
jgi:hypothetical protein